MLYSKNIFGSSKSMTNTEFAPNPTVKAFPKADEDESFPKVDEDES